MKMCKKTAVTLTALLTVVIVIAYIAVFCGYGASKLAPFSMLLAVLVTVDLNLLFGLWVGEYKAN